MSIDANPAPGNRTRSRGLRGCLLAGCLVLVVLAVAPPVVVWSLSESWDAPVSPARTATREYPLPEDRPGRLVLDVKMSEVTIEIGPAGSPLRLETSWHPSHHKFREDFELAADGWEYRVELGGRGLRAWSALRAELDSPQLLLRLPADRALDLEGEIGLGESELALGGASLRSVDLELGTGEHRMSFHRPLTSPLQRLKIDSSMGELEIEGVGNASPREVEVRHGMGELRLDLSGPWRNDALVELRMKMGHAQVDLPSREHAGSLVEESKVLMGSRRIEDQAERDIPPGLPRLRIRASGSMGELEIR